MAFSLAGANVAKKEKEEHAWVLDYLPYGHPDDSRPVYQKKPIIMGIGERYFTLVEMAPKEGKTPQVYDRVYIGDGERDVVDHVKRRLKHEELTQSARVELPYVLEKIILANEAKYLEVYNKSYPITTRLHMLCLFPGIGKKMMRAILDERKKGDFKNFADVSARVKGLYHPARIITKRIEDELRDEKSKYRLFTS